jgi:hypothetical protein
MSVKITASADATETVSGLEPWTRSELPVPPVPKGLGWLGILGPGVIVLGVSLGSGEFLLGPTAFVRYGLMLLWVTGVSSLFQVIFNTELMRYTLATGEPVYTGFMRTRPSSTFWAWFYAILHFLQTGWPGWAGTAAAAIYFLFARRLAGAEDASTVYYIGIGTFLVCVSVLLVGRRIERTLEILNWIVVSAILGSFLILALLFVSGSTWLAAIAGMFAYDTNQGAFNFLPADTDFFLLAALVAYSGAGGVNNIILSNWARDKGYGMGQRAGYIPAAVGGKKVNLAHSGFTFAADPEALQRWSGWWRIISMDQCGVFFAGSILGMMLPALLYVTFLPAGTNIQGLGIAAALANAIADREGPMLTGFVAFLGAWVLFKTQIDIVEGMTRSITDILWTGSRR